MTAINQLYRPLFVEEETDLFTFYHNPFATAYYDHNFFQLYFTPKTREEFNLLEKITLERVEACDLKHLKLTFMPNQKLTFEALEWVTQHGYGLEQLAFMGIDPGNFLQINQARLSNVKAQNIRVVRCTRDNFNTFLKMNYEMNKVNGEAFANQREQVYEEEFIDPQIMFWIASQNDVIVGSCITYQGEGILEIDSFEVLEQFQRQGIGLKIQETICLEATQLGLSMGLLSDMTSDAFEMYQKLGYTIYQEQISLLKEFS